MPVIRGAVTVDREPVDRLRGPGGVEVDVDFVLDTGFTGVVLPSTVFRGSVG